MKRVYVVYGHTSINCEGDTKYRINYFDSETQSFGSSALLGLVPGHSSANGIICAYHKSAQRIICMSSGDGSQDVMLLSSNAAVTEWTALDVNQYPALREFSLTYDLNSHNFVIYGGTNSTSGPASASTWLYDLPNNQWTEIVGESLPGPRASHLKIYETTTNRILLFGGRNSAGIPVEGIWSYGY